MTKIYYLPPQEPRCIWSSWINDGIEKKILDQNGIQSEVNSKEELDEIFEKQDVIYCVKFPNLCVKR